MTDIHATRLVEWAVHQLGRALLIGAVVALGMGIWFGATDSGAALTAGAATLGGFLGFSLALYSCRAPAPLTDEEIDRLVGEDSSAK